jgi:hypothetical protein
MAAVALAEVLGQAREGAAAKDLIGLGKDVALPASAHVSHRAIAMGRWWSEADILHRQPSIVTGDTDRALERAMGNHRRRAVEGSEGGPDLSGGLEHAREARNSRAAVVSATHREEREQCEQWFPRHDHTRSTRTAHFL